MRRGLFPGLLVGTAALTLLAAWTTPASTDNTARVEQFGAVCNGSTDDSTAMASAVSWAQTRNGGRILLPVGQSCAIGSTVAITKSGVTFACDSGSDITASTPGCELKWIGSSGGRMMSIIAPTGSSSNKRLAGNEVRGIRFNGNAGLAADAIYASGVVNGVMDNLTLTGFSGGNEIYIDSVGVPAGSQFGDATSSQYMRVSNINGNNNGYTSNGIKLGANVSANGNASYNYFSNINLTVGTSATHVLCEGCDNNVFVHSGFQGGAISVDLAIVSSGGSYLAAANNIFSHVGWSAAPVARGQTTTPSCTTFSYGSTTTCSWGNIFEHVDKANGSPDPTVEPGAQVIWSDTLGRRYGTFLVGSSDVNAGFVAVSNTGGTNTCGNSAAANAAGEAGYLCGGAAGYLTFDNTNGSRFSMRMGPSGGSSDNFVFQRLAGSGKYEFATEVDIGEATGTWLIATSNLVSNSNTAIPAGGNSAYALIKGSSTSSFGVFFGSGAPTLSAAKGSLYLRSDGSATNNRIYVNTNGSTGWTNLTTGS